MQTNLFFCVFIQSIKCKHIYLPKPKMQEKEKNMQPKHKFAKCMFRHFGLDGVQQSMAQLSN